MTVLQRLFSVETKADAGYVTPLERDVIYSDVVPITDVGGFVRLAPDYSATYEELARRQLWVRIAVNKLSYSIGRLPLKTYSGDTSATRARVRDGSLPALIDSPNGTKDTGTTPGFLARVGYDLMVYANAIILKVQPEPYLPPLELRPFCPRYWSIDSDGYYVYQPSSRDKKQRYEPWRIIHIVEPGPAIGGFGVSRLEAARLTLSIEYAAQRLGESTFNNGARPSSIINIKSGLPTDKISRATAVERFKSEVMMRFGGVSRAGLPAVLEGDIDWQTVSHNLDDSAVVSHRQLTRQEIAALFDIPQPAIGILDEANFASTDALHVIFYQDSLGWPIKLIESAFNAQMVRGVNDWSGQFVEFDLNAVMRGALAERLAAYNTGINAGIYSSDEVRGWENLPPRAATQPEADELRFPMNYATELDASKTTVSPNGAGD